MRTTRNGLHVMNALMQPSETGRGAAAVRGRQLASRLPAAPARFLRPAAVVAAAGLLVTALAPLTASASASRPSAAWRLGGPPVPVLRWRSCDGGFQCATARVPLDYRHPRGAAIRIAMMRHRATSPARRIGSLFFNSGGPSEQIDDFPAEYAGFPPAVRARFDILTFDPRGFGYSTAVRCFPTATAENQFLAGLPCSPSARGRSQRGSGRGPGSTRCAPSATAACSTTTPPPTWPVTWTCCARPSATPC